MHVQQVLLSSLRLNAGPSCIPVHEVCGMGRQPFGQQRGAGSFAFGFQARPVEPLSVTGLVSAYSVDFWPLLPIFV